MGETTESELLTLRRQGKNMGDRPDAYEVVMIIIESDLGTTHASLSIDRRHDWMAVLEPRDDVTFVPRAKADPRPMLMTGFHVPMKNRICPDTVAWACKMDEIYGDPKESPAPTSTPSPKGSETTRH